jgi:hypothetical protein
LNGNCEYQQLEMLGARKNDSNMNSNASTMSTKQRNPGAYQMPLHLKLVYARVLLPIVRYVHFYVNATEPNKPEHLDRTLALMDRFKVKYD